MHPARTILVAVHARTVGSTPIAELIVATLPERSAR
jgi:hypothetical protein